MEYGIERRITPHSNLGATMLVGIPFGVTLKVKFTRASQTYTFPIHLADEVQLQFYSILLVLLKISNDYSPLNSNDQTLFRRF